MVELSVLWCDFGGVLTPPISEAIDSVVRASGVPWEALAAAAEAVAVDLGVHGLGPLELGMLTQAEWAARVTDRLPFAPAVDLARWDEYWYRDREPDHELLGELGRLRSEGVRVGLLTNSVLEWEPHRTRLLADAAFDAVVRSHELGIAKPDPRIFAHADTVLPPAGRVVLVDDLEANCAAAERHGWSAVRHSGTARTIAALGRRRGSRNSGSPFGSDG